MCINIRKANISNVFTFWKFKALAGKLTGYSLFIACCIDCSEPANAKADSLVRLLSAMKDDTNKVKLLDKICKAYRSGFGIQKVMQYAHQETEPARRVGWIKGPVMALEALGKAYAINGDFKKCLALINEAVDLAKKKRPDAGPAFCKTCTVSYISVSSSLLYEAVPKFTIEPIRSLNSILFSMIFLLMSE